MFNPSPPAQPSAGPGTAVGGFDWSQWQQMNAQAGQAYGTEGARRFDDELKARKYQVDQQYRSALLNAKTERERIEVQRWYNEELVRQADEALAEKAREFDKTFGLNEGELTGWYGGARTLGRERQEEELRLAREQLGLSEAGVTGYYGGAPTLERERFGVETARQAAEMRARPDMLFQYRQFAENLPSWLGGPGPRGPGTPAGTGPTPQTISGQLSELGYLSAALPPGGAAAGTASGGVAADPTLAAMGQTYQRGFQALGAQNLESLDPNQLGYLKSAGTFLGWDPDAAIRSYQRSRLGQGVGG